jgi:hypothetical protein
MNDEIAVVLHIVGEQVEVIPQQYVQGYFPHFVQQLYEGSDPRLMRRIEAVINELYDRLRGLCWEEANTCVGEAVILFLELWDRQ